MRGRFRFRTVADLAADLRYAQRTLRRSPGFLATAVTSLALGIGANVAILAALDAVLWRPLPVDDPGRLVRFSVARSGRSDRNALPGELARELRGSGVFTDVAGVSSDGFSFQYDGRAERAQGEVVSPNFFEFLGVQPILGTGFTPQVRAGRWAAETVLSYRFWMRRFGGDPRVAGKVIHLNTYPFTIVGVSPPKFLDVIEGYDPDLRMPVLPDGQEIKESHMLAGGLGVSIARLAPGVSMAQAEGVTDALFQMFLRTSASEQVRRAGYGHVRVLSAAHGLVGDLAPFRAPLLVLLALVGVVLLIACANLAGLLMARSAARQRELATRASIGASRARLVRQMLAESLLIAALGAVFSIPVANASGAALVGFLPQGHTPITVELANGWRTFAFLACLTFAAGALFGLVPALQATRGDLTGMLKSREPRANLRKGLVAAQVAFSVVLLIAAGVFVRTLERLQVADYHAPADQIVLFTLKPQQEIYSPDRVRALTTELVRRVAQLPGVVAAGLAENGPLGSRTDRDVVEGVGGALVQVVSDSVTPGFFDAVGMHRVDGRDFNAGDRQGSPTVAVVNQALARLLFPNQSAVGRTLWISQPARRAFQIVGVVADAHYYDVHGQPPPGVWFAIEQDTPYMPTLHVRTARAEIAATIAAVRHEFDSIDTGFPVFNIKTLQLRIEESMARERMVAELSAAFGALALLLAAIGLYGLLAYSVARRTREIGIRMALGSSARDVVWLMAREALALVAAGTVAGTAIAGAALKLFGQHLIGAAPPDAATLAFAASAIVAIAAIAVSIPAARAARIDPLTALRQE